MNEGSTENSGKVTVLVFKDNFAARTFQIPLNWISRFGIFLGILVGVTTVSVFIALKYYRVILRTDSSRVQGLEQELTDLRSSLKTLETKTSESTPVIHSPQHTASTTAEPTSSNTPITPPPSASGNSFVFSAFPASTLANIPNPSTLPFVLQTPKASWKGKTLSVQFALQYTKPDHGNQQGRILILARGPDSLFAYPTGIFNKVGSDYLISPEKGESFSVSRFREVRADFGPVRTHQAITEIEIFILDKEGQILIYQKIFPNLLKKPEKQARPIVPEPSSESETLALPDSSPETTTESSPLTETTHP